MSILDILKSDGMKEIDNLYAFRLAKKCDSMQTVRFIQGIPTIVKKSKFQLLMDKVRGERKE